VSTRQRFMGVSSKKDVRDKIVKIAKIILYTIVPTIVGIYACWVYLFPQINIDILDRLKGASGETIFLVAKLPKTDMYKRYGKMVDIGIVYRYNGIINYDKRWCLFDGGHYWVTEKTQLDEIAKNAGIKLPSKKSLPIWKAGITYENKLFNDGFSLDDKIGIYLILGIIIIPSVCVILWNELHKK
jgi:hypothetical protein